MAPSPHIRTKHFRHHITAIPQHPRTHRHRHAHIKSIPFYNNRHRNAYFCRLSVTKKKTTTIWIESGESTGSMTFLWFYYFIYSIPSFPLDWEAQWLSLCYANFRFGFAFNLAILHWSAECAVLCCGSCTLTVNSFTLCTITMSLGLFKVIYYWSFFVCVCVCELFLLVNNINKPHPNSFWLAFKWIREVYCILFWPWFVFDVGSHQNRKKRKKCVPYLRLDIHHMFILWSNLFFSPFILFIKENFLCADFFFAYKHISKSKCVFFSSCKFKMTTNFDMNLAEKFGGFHPSLYQ